MDPSVPIDFCAIPAQAPPDGQISNLIDPPDLHVAIIASCTIFLAIASTFLAGRLFMNWGKLKAADYVVVAGFVQSTSFTCTVVALRNLTRHMWDTPACWYMSEYFLKLLFALNMLTAPTQFTVKLSILLLYLQMFSVNRRTRHAIWGTIIGGGLIYFVYAVLIATYEAPRAGENWITPYSDTRMLKLIPYGPIRSLGGFFMDVCILVLPFPIVRKLNVSRKRKLQLGAVFVTGAFGVTASAVSTYWCFMILLDKPGDQSWQQVQIFIWIMIEVNIAVIVACMPAFAAFIRVHLMGRGRDTTHEKKRPVDADNFKLVDQPQKPRPRAYYYQFGDSILDTTLNTTHTDTTVVGQDPDHSFPSATYQPGEIMVTKQVVQDNKPYSVV